MDAMNIDYAAPQLELPGGDNFHDVTSVFTSAAADMEPESVVLLDGFTLHDAMSAFEIGEPRLDTGMALDTEKESQSPFNPLTPLLPQELCWILDRSFSYEMEWHAGNVISHTVFTLLYVHHLQDIDPDLIPYGQPEDWSRPMGLITTVLWGAVAGLLKCCDITWRELSKGDLKDSEDWQSDKCEVSLLEAFQHGFILSKVEDAITWLSRTNKVTILWRNALLARLNLRKTLLQLFSPNTYPYMPGFPELINQAREHLHSIRVHPSPEPDPDSPARRAFDPYVARRLNTFIPIRVIDVPTAEDTWSAMDRFLDGWEELSVLSLTGEISTWDIAGNLRVWLPDAPLQAPYIRSSIQTAFFDGFLILNKYTTESAFLVNRFFFETLGVPFTLISQSVRRRWRGPAPVVNTIAEVERSVTKIMTSHIRGHWLNPPRRRRHFMKILVDWHSLYDILSRLVDDLETSDLARNDLLLQLPKAVLLWRLGAIREVVLSGFQLELYTSEEKPFAYWYLAQVLETHLKCLDELLPVVDNSTSAYYEMLFQQQFLAALQVMSIAAFSVSMSLMSFSWERMSQNFTRRYKWAFRSEYYDIETPVVMMPSIQGFLSAGLLVAEDPWFSPSENFKFAQSILTHLLESGNLGGWAGHWEVDRIRFVQNLAETCEALCGLPDNMKEVSSTFDVGLLKWDPQKNPWFPLLDAEGAERRRNVHVKRTNV